jgi:hypothetical protein
MDPQNSLIWKTIPGYENYEISHSSIVKNVKFCSMKTSIEIPMKHFINKRVTVYKNEKRKFYYINKLLKEVFTPDELSLKETNDYSDETNEFKIKLQNSRIEVS